MDDTQRVFVEGIKEYKVGDLIELNSQGIQDLLITLQNIRAFIQPDQYEDLIFPERLMKEGYSPVWAQYTKHHLVITGKEIRSFNDRPDLYDFFYEASRLDDFSLTLKNIRSKHIF